MLCTCLLPSAVYATAGTGTYIKGMPRHSKSVNIIILAVADEMPVLAVYLRTQSSIALVHACIDMLSD